jgi:hypothetical protein
MLPQDCSSLIDSLLAACFKQAWYHYTDGLGALSKLINGNGGFPRWIDKRHAAQADGSTDDRWTLITHRTGRTITARLTREAAGRCICDCMM